MKSNKQKGGIIMSETEQILSNFARTTEEFFSLKEFEELLSQKKQLRIKYGVDITAPHLHIGHAVNLWMMRNLQDFGHKVIFLIGDFTTQIGDPTGKSKTRPIISKEDIDKNTAEFIEQARMVLRFDNPDLLEIRRNSEWYGSLSAVEFLKLMKMVTHSRLISRDMFQKRIAEKADIYMHELVYPILQGYDSVVLDSDLTIVGSDQLFNEMLGRFFQEKFDQRQQVIITTKITPGIDGATKQSKSLNNYIGLGHSPRDKFGRVMKLPDDLIFQYFQVYTEIVESKLQKMADMTTTNPLEAKKCLATEIVRRYHGDLVAKEERLWFDHTFSSRQIPNDTPALVPKDKNMQAIEIIRQFFGSQKSSSDMRRLIQQGGLTLNGEKITNPLKHLLLTDGDLFRVGKHIWFRIKL